MKYLFSATLFFAVFTCICQVSVNYQIGISTSVHEQLKDISTATENNNLLELERVNNFDPAFYQQLGASFKFAKKHQLRLIYSWVESGIKSGIKDPTGYYFFQQHVKLKSFGFGYQFFVNQNLSFGLRFGFTKTENLVIEQFVLFEEEIFNDRLKLNAAGIELIPSLTYQIKLNDKFSIPIECGYSFDSSNVFELDGQETNVEPNWSGLRLSLGFAFSINLK